MDDADAALPAVAAAFDEVLHARARFRHRHTVQVVPIAGGVVASSEPSDFPPVNTGRGEGVVTAVDGFVGRRRARGQVDEWSVKDPAARVRPKGNDVGHLELEGLHLRRRIAAGHDGGEALPLGLLHRTILPIYRVSRRTGRRQDAGSGPPVS